MKHFFESMCLANFTVEFFLKKLQQSLAWFARQN